MRYWRRCSKQSDSGVDRAVCSLLKGKSMRSVMLEGYSTRYNIFILIVVAIGVVSIAAALIMRFL